MAEITIKNHTEIQKMEFQIAKIRYRVLAFTIDFYIFTIIGFTLGFFFGSPLENEAGYNMSGLPALGLMLIGLFLWPISEGIWGQTIGKRILNLKVVTNEFKPIRIGQAFGRFFLGFIDYFFLIGIIIASINKENKRIGDLAANTIVVRIKKHKHNKI